MDLGPIDDLIEPLRVDVEARLAQNGVEAFAAVTIMALVVPEGVVAIEGDEVEWTHGASIIEGGLAQTSWTF